VEGISGGKQSGAVGDLQGQNFGGTTKFYSVGVSNLSRLRFTEIRLGQCENGAAKSAAGQSRPKHAGQSRQLVHEEIEFGCAVFKKMLGAAVRRGEQPAHFGNIPTGQRGHHFSDARVFLDNMLGRLASTGDNTDRRAWNSSGLKIASNATPNAFAAS
jgi:hypothetical protein